jgi:hypothetical protein
MGAGSTYFPLQSLEYIEATRRRLELEGVAADR